VNRVIEKQIKSLLALQHVETSADPHGVAAHATFAASSIRALLEQRLASMLLQLAWQQADAQLLVAAKPPEATAISPNTKATSMMARMIGMGHLRDRQGEFLICMDLRQKNRRRHPLSTLLTENPAWPLS